jgi:hypothetical protein
MVELKAQQHQAMAALQGDYARLRQTVAGYHAQLAAAMAGQA